MKEVGKKSEQFDKVLADHNLQIQDQSFKEELIMKLARERRRNYQVYQLQQRMMPRCMVTQWLSLNNMTIICVSQDYLPRRTPPPAWSYDQLPVLVPRIWEAGWTPTIPRPSIITHIAQPTLADTQPSSSNIAACNMVRKISLQGQLAIQSVRFTSNMVSNICWLCGLLG